MNKHDMTILCSHWKHMHHSKPENLDAVSPLPACKVNRSGAWTTIAEGAQGKLTCRDVVHTIASLMDSNVTALTEDYEVGRNREATAADCTHGLFIFCAPRQHILELPCHQRNLHQLTAAGSLVTSCFGGHVAKCLVDRCSGCWIDRWYRCLLNDFLLLGMNMQTQRAALFALAESATRRRVYTACGKCCSAKCSMSQDHTGRCLSCARFMHAASVM